MKKYFSTDIIKGIFWAGTASALWGISNTLLQVVSQIEKLPSVWFLAVRYLAAGLIFLVISLFVFKKQCFTVFKSFHNILIIIGYGALGLAANGFAFLMSVQTGNAAIAAILQYLAPLTILLGAWIFQHKKPLRIDVVVFIMALIGISLAITKGDFSSLVVPMNALLWGIAAGITSAFYVVIPKPIIKAGVPALIVSAWGTLIAALIFNVQNPFWVGPPKINLIIFISIVAIILVGTVLPFLCLLYSLNFAPSVDASLTDAIQPVVTLLLSVLFLGLKVNFAQIIGVILVIMAIYVLQRSKSKRPDELKDN